MTDEPDDDQRILHKAVKRASLRDTHPLLFKCTLAIAIFEIGLALNFATYVPTFNPLPRHVVAVVFLVVGTAQVIALTLYRRRTLFLMLTTISLVVLIGWGAFNLPQGIRRAASFQLPAFCLIVGVLQYFMLREPGINPLTASSVNEKLSRPP